MTSVLDPPAIRDFAGELLVPGDPGYEKRRRVVNAAVGRFPALIARCAGRDDVAAALRHARERGLPVTGARMPPSAWRAPRSARAPAGWSASWASPPTRS